MVVKFLQQRVKLFGLNAEASKGRINQADDSVAFIKIHREHGGRVRLFVFGCGHITAMNPALSYSAGGSSSTGGSSCAAR